MNDPDAPEIANGNGITPGSMTVSEVTGLINLFSSQLLAMEGRLVIKMDDNSRLASERWVKHDAELVANTKRVVDRFEKMEQAILIVEKALKEHLDREHDEDLVVQARIKPVKSVLVYTTRNWRTMALWLMLFLTAFGVIAGRLYDFLGYTP